MRQEYQEREKSAISKTAVIGKRRKTVNVEKQTVEKMGKRYII